MMLERQETSRSGSAGVKEQVQAAPGDARNRREAEVVGVEREREGGDG